MLLFFITHMLNLCNGCYANDPYQLEEFISNLKVVKLLDFIMHMRNLHNGCYTNDPNQLDEFISLRVIRQ